MICFLLFLLFYIYFKYLFVLFAVVFFSVCLCFLLKFLMGLMQPSTINKHSFFSCIILKIRCLINKRISASARSTIKLVLKQFSDCNPQKLIFYKFYFKFKGIHITALLKKELIIKQLTLLELSIKMFLCFPEIFNRNKYVESSIEILQSQNKENGLNKLNVRVCYKSCRGT